MKFPNIRCVEIETVQIVKLTRCKIALFYKNRHPSSDIHVLAQLVVKNIKKSLNYNSSIILTVQLHIERSKPLLIFHMNTVLTLLFTLTPLRTQFQMSVQKNTQKVIELCAIVSHTLYQYNT